MNQRYSMDVRERVMTACDNGQTAAERDREDGRAQRKARQQAISAASNSYSAASKILWARVRSRASFVFRYRVSNSVR